MTSCRDSNVASSLGKVLSTPLGHLRPAGERMGGKGELTTYFLDSMKFWKAGVISAFSMTSFTLPIPHVPLVQAPQGGRVLIKDGPDVGQLQLHGALSLLDFVQLRLHSALILLDFVQLRLHGIQLRLHDALSLMDFAQLQLHCILTLLEFRHFRPNGSQILLEYPDKAFFG